MKENNSEVKDQVLYLNRWVDRKTFRVFVHSKDSEKLANDYIEYEKLIATGLWFDSKEEANLVRKSKNGTIS